MRRMFDERGNQWITPTLMSGTTGDIKYRKTFDGKVEFIGQITTPGEAFAFYLPKGYYNEGVQRYVVVCDNNSGGSMNLAITTTGGVYVAQAGQTSLDFIIYSVKE